MADVIAAPLRMLHMKVPFFLLKCKRGQIWFRSFSLQCKRDEKSGIVPKQERSSFCSVNGVLLYIQIPSSQCPR